MSQTPHLRRAFSERRMKKKVPNGKRVKSPRPRNKDDLIQKSPDLSRRDSPFSVRGESISVNLPPFCGMEQSRRRYHPDGLLLIWHQNGQLWIECDYLDGKRFGKFTSWYPDGTKSQVSYWAHGLKTGSREMWGKTGKRVVYDYWLGGVRIKEYFNLLKLN